MFLWQGMWNCNQGKFHTPLKRLKKSLYILQICFYSLLSVTSVSCVSDAQFPGPSSNEILTSCGFLWMFWFWCKWNIEASTGKLGKLVSFYWMSLLKEEIQSTDACLNAQGNNFKVVGCWWHCLAFWASSKHLRSSAELCFHWLDSKADVSIELELREGLFSWLSLKSQECRPFPNRKVLVYKYLNCK